MECRQRFWIWELLWITSKSCFLLSVCPLIYQLNYLGVLLMFILLPFLNLNLILEPLNAFLKVVSHNKAYKYFDSLTNKYFCLFWKINPFLAQILSMERHLTLKIIFGTLHLSQTSLVLELWVLVFWCQVWKVLHGEKHYKLTQQVKILNFRFILDETWLKGIEPR